MGRHLESKEKPFHRRPKREDLCEGNTREKLYSQPLRAQMPQHSGLVRFCGARFSLSTVFIIQKKNWLLIKKFERFVDLTDLIPEGA